MTILSNIISISMRVFRLFELLDVSAGGVVALRLGFCASNRKVAGSNPIGPLIKAINLQLLCPGVLKFSTHILKNMHVRLTGEFHSSPILHGTVNLHPALQTGPLTCRKNSGPLVAYIMPVFFCCSSTKINKIDSIEISMVFFDCRKITGIAYCCGLQWLVTAARDGSIKVWDKAWRLQMVFVGHTAPVTALVTFPHVPHLLSASQDGTMRIWNLQTADQVEEIQTVHVALGLGVSEDNTGEADCTGLIFSFSSQGVDFWDLTQLYNILTPLEAPVRSIQMIVLHRFPPRAVCVCEDASIRLIAAETGDIITSFFLEEPRQIRAVDYCLPLETLFVVTDKGEVLRINALTNPASLVDRSFEHHGGVEKKFLLVVGHEHGYLSVLDWDTRLPAYKTEAHISCCVSALMAYSKCSFLCFFSSGEDKMVKVWRVFPYADESLSLHMSFCCAQPPLKVSCLGSLLAVAFQELSSATYGIVHYHLETKSRSDHPPKDDPQDLITGGATSYLKKLRQETPLVICFYYWLQSTKGKSNLKID
uniref:Uncharacterized protein n=1 Tax=Erpetoichthys calabaricus TaxID=27687 RepID=A0A8C4SL02_ERPCA